MKATNPKKEENGLMWNTKTALNKISAIKELLKVYVMHLNIKMQFKHCLLYFYDSYKLPYVDLNKDDKIHKSEALKTKVQTNNNSCRVSELNFKF